MLNLLEWFLKLTDPLKLAELSRTRKDRKSAARLFHILFLSYDIIELAEILLEELRAALESEGEPQGGFRLNPWHVGSLLRAQMDNLERLETLMQDLYGPLRLLSPEFKRKYEILFAGKLGVLHEAQMVMYERGFPLHLATPDDDRAAHAPRILTFPIGSGDNREAPPNILGHPGAVEISYRDAESFFREVERYLREDDPLGTLQRLRQLTDQLKDALVSNLDLQGLMSELGKIQTRHHRAT